MKREDQNRDEMVQKTRKFIKIMDSYKKLESLSGERIKKGTFLHQIQKEIDSLLSKVRDYSPTEKRPFTLDFFTAAMELANRSPIALLGHLFRYYDENICKILHRNGLTFKMSYNTDYRLAKVYYLFCIPENEESHSVSILTNQEHKRIMRHFVNKLPEKKRSLVLFYGGGT